MRASEVTAKHVEAMFLAAMRKGWAFGFKAVPVEDSPGVKRLEYRDGHWFVRDEYSTTMGQKSGGITRIWFRNILVWEMHYWGEYEEAAIRILKAILRETYGACQFRGGRGNDDLPASEGLLYENTHRGGFQSFSGRERMIDVAHQGRQVGHHHYSGGLMVDLPLPDSKADLIVAEMEEKLEEIDFGPVFMGEEIQIEEFLVDGDFKVIEILCIYPRDSKGNGYFYLLCCCGEVDGYTPVANTPEELGTFFKREMVSEFTRVFHEDSELAELWEL